MGNFNRDNRGGGGRDFGGRRDFNRGGGFGGGSRGGERQMHTTTCSNCGKECQVPFKPTGSKPVFCSDCFEKQNGGDRPRFGGGDRDRGPRRFDSNRSEQPRSNVQLDEVNAKLDKILAMLEGTQGAKKPAKEAKVEPLVPVIEVVEEKAPIKEVEMPEVPQEEKMVEELQLSPEEPIVVEKKKRVTKKDLPVTE